MSTVGGGVNIVRDGLVMYLDASNTKSLADVPSQNLCLYSEQFENSYFNKTAILVSSNVINSPINTLTADKIIENTTTSPHGMSVSQSVINQITDYTTSFYIKKGEKTQCEIWTRGLSSTNRCIFNINLLTKTISFQSNQGNFTRISETMTDVGDDWFRITTSIRPFSGETFIQCYLWYNSTTTYSGDGTSGIYVWGAQLEIGPVATTYIPTTTVPVSRTPTWVDLSKGGNNGTLTGGLTYNYSNGGGLVFNGTTSYVNCGNILNYTSGNFSFSYWIYVNSLTTNQPGQGPIILFKGQYQVNGYYDQINTGGGIAFNTNTNGALVGSGTGYGVILTGRTYNICYTRNGSSIRIYVNGVDVTVNSGTHLDPVSSSSNFLINSYGGTIFSNVRTYSFSNYNRALSASEVLQNFNASKSKFGLL